MRLAVESTSSKAPLAKIADKVSSVFVPAVIAIAIVALLFDDNIKRYCFCN